MTGTRNKLSRILTVTALVIAGLLGSLAAIFTVGEAFTDPGGWLAVGITAAWLLPLVGLIALALRRPDVAKPTLLGLTGVWVAVCVWAVVAWEAWGSFEDEHGPIRAIALLVVALPLAALGRTFPLEAGSMVLTAALTPLLLGWLMPGGAPAGPLTVIIIPVTLLGAMLVAAGIIQGRAHPAEPQVGGRISPETPTRSG